MTASWTIEYRSWRAVSRRSGGSDGPVRPSVTEVPTATATRLVSPTSDNGGRTHSEPRRPPGYPVRRHRNARLVRRFSSNAKCLPGRGQVADSTPPRRRRGRGRPGTRRGTAATAIARRPSSCTRHTSPRPRPATVRGRLELSGAGPRRRPWMEACLVRNSEGGTADAIPWPLCMLGGEGCRCQLVLETETEQERSPKLNTVYSNERDPCET